MQPREERNEQGRDEREERNEQGTEQRAERNDRNSNPEPTTNEGKGTGVSRGQRKPKQIKSEEEKKLSEVVTLEKPKPKKTKKSKQGETETVGQMSALLQSLSLIIASREGFEHWAISEQEATSLVNPLYNMLTKNEMFSKISEHSDALALVTASTMILLPRAMVSLDRLKEKRKKKKVVTYDKIRETNADSRQGSSDPTSFYSSVSTSLPATVEQLT